MRLIKNEKGNVVFTVKNIKKLSVYETIEGFLNVVDVVEDDREQTEYAIFINEYIIAKYNNRKEAIKEFNELIEFLKGEEKEFIVHGTKKNN